MFDLATAMFLANKQVVQKNNPKNELEEIVIEPAGGGNRYALMLRRIGEGTFSEAYITDDKEVIILTMGEETKGMLADIYNEYGEMAYIPKVEYLGDAFSEGYQMEAYKSPLYAVPIDYNKSHKAYHMYLMLREIVFDVNNKLDQPYEWDEDNTSTFSQKQRANIYDALEKSLNKKPKKIGDIDSDLTSEEWNGFAQTIMFLIQKSFEYSFFWIMEINTYNLGTDANGQLILLDIFFDKLAQEQGLGRY